MAHRIETKVGQGVSYQLEVGGTPPIDCTVVVGPPGIAIDPVTKILTVPGASFTEPRIYPVSVQCQNCSGSVASLSIQINAGEDINCTPITPRSPICICATCLPLIRRALLGSPGTLATCWWIFPRTCGMSLR